MCFSITPFLHTW